MLQAAEQEDMRLEVYCRRTVRSIRVAIGELKALVEVLPRIGHVIGHIVNDEAGCNFALEIGVDIGTCERQQCGQCQQWCRPPRQRTGTTRPVSNMLSNHW